MPIRNLNDPDQHDGTNLEFDFGGPYHLYVGLTGETVIQEEVGKGDRLYIALTPLGETEEGETDA